MKMTREQMQAEQEKRLLEIRQLENRQRILLRKEINEERRLRTRRLIEHGAVLESIFPRTKTMSGEEVKAFLQTLFRLPEVQKTAAEWEEKSSAGEP